MVAVELKAPRLVRRRRAEDTDPIEPLAVFLRLAGDFERVFVKPHDIARKLVAGCAEAFAHQAERGVALVLAEVG